MGSTRLVTGSAGFIGSTLVDSLQAAGHVVRGVDRAECRRPSGCAARRVDLASDELDALLRDVDVVYHLAGRPGVQTSWGAGFEHHVRDNIVATDRLLDAAARTGVRRVVMASSSSVYGATRRRSGSGGQTRPVSPYGVTKLAAEQLAGVYAQRGLDVVVLRLFTVYGPRQRADMAIHRIIAAAIDGPAFALRGDGSQRRSFTHVDDVVRALELVAEHPHVAGATFDVGGRRQASLVELLAVVEALTGRSVPVQRVPRPPGDPDVVLAHPGPLEALGWRPSVELTYGIGTQVDWQCGVAGRGARDLMGARR
ncbi:MAG: NAD(P)-dependent oxidoreductase [Acidimicrobiia bacterium]|nr:NAD(P)-dependent oxidoreductase [Acidimicrobiia bacterium]